MQDDISTDPTTVTDGGAVTTATTSNDPLDTITDPEELRRIAKSRGSAYERVKEERDALKVNLSPSDPLQKPVTKADMRNDAMVEAKQLVGEEIAGKWNVLLDYVPAKHRNAYTAEGIATAMKAAHAAFLVDNPPQDAPNPGAALQTDAGIQGKGKAPTSNQAPATPSKWDEPTGPDSWFVTPK